MTDSKTVVLSAIDKSNKKAVMNLELYHDEYQGTLRLYNFKESPRGILTLGILIQNTVYKAALTEKSTSLYSFNFKTQEPISKFSCALINIQNGEPRPILLGTNEKNPPNDLSSSLVKNFKFLDESYPSLDEVENSLNENQLDYDEEEKEEIEKAINLECDDKCLKCNYRNAFYDNCENLEINNTPKKQNKPIYPMSEGRFYNEVKDQLSLLFDKYPEDTFLTEVIPNSKWVKVDYEDDGHYIVIGLIYENNEVSYVCYGSPGQYSADPPREFKNLSQWLPLDPEKPEELGYWIIYQDAESGENVEINIS